MSRWGDAILGLFAVLLPMKCCYNRRTVLQGQQQCHCSVVYGYADDSCPWQIPAGGGENFSNFEFKAQTFTGPDLAVETWLLESSVHSLRQHECIIRSDGLHNRLLCSPLWLFLGGDGF